MKPLPNIRYRTNRSRILSTPHIKNRELAYNGKTTNTFKNRLYQHNLHQQFYEYVNKISSYTELHFFSDGSLTKDLDQNMSQMGFGRILSSLTDINLSHNGSLEHWSLKITSAISRLNQNLQDALELLQTVNQSRDFTEAYDYAHIVYMEFNK
ncbi:10118_t:CDS:2 [Rhizophagus irregularis]|nr:10118_t:CDS:2 [Rhizophagus irregularis]